MKYIGLDCHKQYDHATMIDTETGEIKEKRLAHIKEDFSDFIGDYCPVSFFDSKYAGGHLAPIFLEYIHVADYPHSIGSDCWF